ncbi:MAG: hypothetical protein ACOX7B_04770 [Christensenellales bacterium]|jgi:NRPS condensation-like uncharacterized protein
MARRKKRPQGPEWLKLDNAAKIYPAVKSRKWTALYRLSVTLTEDVDEAVLSKALEHTVQRIPFFTYQLKRGFFWFYLDRQTAVPKPEPDVANPLVRMRLNQDNPFLFRIRVWQKRIAIEIFHALTDGTGGLVFLLTLTAEYLRLKYSIAVEPSPYILDTRHKPQPEEMEDSFLTYARKARRARTESRAYPLRGTKGDPMHLRIIMGSMPTQKLYDTAKAHGATVNVFLASLLLQALYRIAQSDPSPRRRKLPVKLSMPVNLRRYYPSRTLRNFSSYVNAPIYTEYGDWTLEQIINQVKSFSDMEMAEPMLNARFSANVAAEQNKVLRAAPLFIKTPVLRFMYWLTGERYFTSTLSNLGIIKLPDGMLPHVEKMALVLGPAKSNAASCGCVSFGGTTTITFSASIIETEFERRFFTSLIQLGIPVLVQSNQRGTTWPIASNAE